MRFNFEQLERRLKMKLGEDETLEFKPHLFENKRGIENPILRSIVALANAQGGNLVIGVEQQSGNFAICGISHDQDYVNNWLSQIVYEYVEPDGLSFVPYPIESSERSLKCIGIEVNKQRGRYFAVRYSGRSSKGDGKLSYYFPMRIGDSTRLLDSFSFIRNIFSSWAMGFSEISKQEIFPISAKTTRGEINLEQLEIRITELRDIEEKSTRSMLFEELRSNILINLPNDQIDPWSDRLRKLVFEFLDVLMEEINKEDIGKKEILRMLVTIAYNSDNKTLKEIENNFLTILEKFYRDPKFKKTSDLIRLLQILHQYDPDYMEKIVKDSIERWDINDFDNVFGDIDILRYLYGHDDRMRKLRLYALKGIESARENQNIRMQERFEKLYSRLR